MPFVPVPGAAMVELFFLQDGQQLENTLYFRQPVAYTDLELATLAEEVALWWITNMAPLTVSQVVLRGVKATSLESQTAPAIELPQAAPGALAQPAEPNNVTIAVKFLTAGRGRSARGRNYIVGLHVDAVTNNQVSQAHLDQIIQAYGQLLAPGTITEGAWSVVSRFENGLPRTTGIAQLVTDVTATDNIVDSQRRRLPGRGT